MEEDQYGIPDLRHYIPSRPLFPPPPDLLPTHRPALPYDMLIFRPDSANAAAASSSAATTGGCLFDSGGGGGDGGTGRWPRQETLTLLEIRSRLDHKFKEANQKGPLWDEVSRIMSEEHGYQRSGKKCREKFENLYKYYKKTKEGKAGRQDGKHYRFFRQLEALYGEPNTHNPVPILSENRSFHSEFHSQTPRNQELIPGDTSLSLSNYSDADTSSSDASDEGKTKKRGGKSGWKIKIKDFIDLQMKKLMDKQEAWMEKMMRTIEEKERERMIREEEWRKQDSERIEREHRFWASERAWIEARDASLMEALQKLTGGENRNEIWPEGEINRLVQLRTAAEGRFQERGAASEEVLWEEIATKMACFGHERSGISCREKWDSVNNYLLKCNKKRKEDTKSCTYFEPSSQGGGMYCDPGEPDRSVVRSPAANAITENCFRYFMGDGYGRIME